jgi:rubredoxin
MGILDRLFGKKDSTPGTAVEERPIEVECPHGTMTPRWDNPEDLGKTELISSYTCESCGKTFSREEGQRIMAKAAEVLKVDDELRKSTEEMVEGEKESG